MNLSRNLSNVWKLSVPVYSFFFIIQASIILFYFQNNIYPNQILALLSFCFAIFGLNAYNQVTDIDIDRLSKKYRPLITNELSVSSVKKIVFFYYFLSIALIIPTFNFHAVLSVFSFILLSFIYSRNVLNIRKFFGSNTFGAFFYGFSPTYLAQCFIPKDITAVILFSTLNTIFISALKDFEDADADKINGINTIPNYFGIQRAKEIIVSALLLSLSGMTLYLSGGSTRVFDILPFFLINLLLILSFKYVWRFEKKWYVVYGLTYSLVSLGSFILFF